MKDFFGAWWDTFISPRGWWENPVSVAVWFSIVLSQIGALLLGGLGGIYIQGLIHARGALANSVVLIGTALVSFLLDYGLQYGADKISRRISVDSSAGWAVVVAFILINVAMIVAAGYAVYTYFAGSVRLSSNIAIGALVLSIALKLGSFLLIGVILPVLKSIPALLFGLVAKDWYARRKARQKVKVR